MKHLIRDVQNLVQMCYIILGPMDQKFCRLRYKNVNTLSQIILLKIRSSLCNYTPLNFENKCSTYTVVPFASW